MNELALFAGAGGGILGGHLLGWRTRCAVELDAYARAVLLQRQADGCLPRFPIWDDVRTFDGHQWRGRVQVVSGGFPCTDISRANANAEGLDGDKSGLWFEMARIIGEVRPDYALVENSPFLVGRGLERVVADLAELGYDARWGVLGAYHAGAPHARERIWIVAHAMRARKPDGWAGGFGRWIGGEGETAGDLQGRAGSQSNGMWEVEPAVCGVASRVADKLDKHRAARLRGIGNGQVPAVAAMAWRLLTANLMMIIIAIALTLTQPAPCKRNTVAGHTTARLGQIMAARWEARKSLPVKRSACSRLTNLSSRRLRLVTGATV